MKIRKKRGHVLVLVGLILFCWKGVSQAQGTSDVEAKEVISSGLGSIIGGDIAHARDDAIEDALRRGIEQALGLVLESETFVENYQLIEDNIFSKTQGYVQKYSVIRERKRDDQLYEVTVNAVVKMTDLENDLEGIKTLMRRKNTPRMMMMIEERNIGETAGSQQYFEADMNTAETALMESFMEKGFRFVDQATVKRNLNREQAAAILEGDVAQAASLGRSVGAEVVLTGKSLAKSTVIEAFGAKQRSQQATVTVRAIRTDTGDIIATGSAQGAFPHIDDVVGGTKAIQKACKKLSEDIMSKILDRWQADVSSGALITLKVQGVSSYSQLNRFKSALKYYVRGLTSVQQRDWYGSLATLELEMKGSAEDLAQRLSDKDVNGSRVKVMGVSQNSVTIELSQSE